MVSLGKQLRLRRLLREGKSVVVPMDHAIYSGPVPGLEDLRGLVAKVARSEADAILCTPGTLEQVADVLDHLGVILRIDGTHTRLGRHLERTGLIGSVEEALRLGVEAVVVNIFLGTDNEDELLGKLGKVAGDCRREGMVLVAEMIPSRLLERHYGSDTPDPSPEERADLIATAARVGAEIGADLLKINYSGSLTTYKTVVASATRPVLVAGGMKSGNDLEFLETVHDALSAGAAGICAGRNVWQRAEPIGILNAVTRIVHHGASVEDALKSVEG